MLFVPAVLAALGLGSIGFGAYSSSKKPSKAAVEERRAMPPALMEATQAMLQNGHDPAAMEAMAATLEGYGYRNTAGELRDRAAELRKAAAEGKPAPPPTPLITSMAAPTPTPAAVATATVTGTGVNMRSAPSTTGGIVGQLNKPEIVTVLNWNAGTSNGYQWAQVKKSSGQTGYAAKNYLALNAPAPPGVSGQDMAFIGAEDTGPFPARCVAPSGCRLRKGPKPDSAFDGVVANGERVTVLKRMSGLKAERRSPGVGGWSLVRAGKKIGWVPSEWLL